MKSLEVSQENGEYSIESKPHLFDGEKIFFHKEQEHLGRKNMAYAKEYLEEHLPVNEYMFTALFLGPNWDRNLNVLPTFDHLRNIEGFMSDNINEISNRIKKLMSKVNYPNISEGYTIEDMRLKIAETVENKFSLLLEEEIIEEYLRVIETDSRFPQGFYTSGNNDVGVILTKYMIGNILELSPAEAATSLTIQDFKDHKLNDVLSHCFSSIDNAIQACYGKNFNEVEEEGYTEISALFGHLPEIKEEPTEILKTVEIIEIQQLKEKLSSEKTLDNILSSLTQKKADIYEIVTIFDTLKEVGTLRHKSYKIIDTLNDSLIEHFNQLAPSDITDIVDVLSTINYKGQVWNTLGYKIEDVIGKSNQKYSSDDLISIAKIGAKSKRHEILSFISKKITSDEYSSEFSTKKIVKLAEFFSNQSSRDKIFPFIKDQIIAEKEKLNIKDIVSVSSSLSRAGFVNFEFYEHINNLIISGKYEGNPSLRDLEDLVFSFRKTNDKFNSMFEFISQQVNNIISDEIQPNQYNSFSRIALSYAISNKKDDIILSHLEKMAKKTHLGNRSFANTVYALALLSEKIPTNMVEALPNYDGFKSFELTKLMMGLSLAGITIPENIQRQYNNYTEIIDVVQSKSTVSERVVSEYLARHTDDVVEQSVFFNGFEMDFSIPSRKVNIEVDGPYHSAHRDNLRDQYFTEQGWTVLRIKSSQVANGEYRQIFHKKMHLLN